MPKLAINGGNKIRENMFPAYRTIGKEEEEAAKRVINSGVLSKFLGCWHEDFYGGPEVQSFEEIWADYFNVKHAISVNSATSGLFCAVGASGIGPGDEVIVSPYTMSASAVAPLIYNAIPIFADIEEDYFCLDVESIKQKITEKTRAIIIVDIFGQPYNMEAVNALAKEHNLIVIEDCAQAPGAKYGNKWAGTLGDIGIYSLNYHKHIHTGEGGVIVTDNDELAERLRMIRNHAEAVAGGRQFHTLVNMLGFNYRMTEIEAAIGKEQLKKLPSLLDQRIENVEYLAERLQDIPCLEPGKIRNDCKHAFYIHPVKFNSEIAGIHRNKFVEAVKAELTPVTLREDEGVIIGCGYMKPLYRQSLYQQKIAYGGTDCPWGCSKYGKEIDYTNQICAVTEKMHTDILITHEYIRPPMTKTDLDDVANAFEKVWENIEELKKQEKLYDPLYNR